MNYLQYLYYGSAGHFSGASAHQQQWTHTKRASSLSKATLFGTHESEATFNKQQPCFDARLSE